jgi:hypothetical protein
MTITAEDVAAAIDEGGWKYDASIEWEARAAALVRSLERIRVAAEAVKQARYDHGAAGDLWPALGSLENALNAHRKEFGS